MKRFREENHIDDINTRTASDSDQIGDFYSTSSDESVESNLKKQTVNNSRGESSYYILGCNYLDGIDGAEKDYLKAFELFTKGAEEGCLESMYNIGYCYDDGLGVEQDYLKAFEWYLKAAESGHADSQFCIAEFYDDGLGVEKDYLKAFEWYLKASENGDVYAHHNIALLYDSGCGVERDYVKAFEWYLKAAEGGLAKSQFRVGCLYDNGKGVKQDSVKAFEWYLKAAENGEVGAQFNIGYSYENGEGVEQDYLKALEWYLKAAERGLAKSHNNIGRFYEKGLGVEQDYRKAYECYLKASDNGNAMAQLRIGGLYENGRGFEKDYLKALEWYLKASENGEVGAQYFIGTFYYKGLGVEQDDIKAFEWYSKSAQNGFKFAQYNVGCCYEYGEGVEEDMKKSVYWHAKRLNEIDFKFIESYHEFGIEQFKNCDYNDSDNLKENTSEIVTEQVIIRFSEKDFKVSNNLSNSKYLSTMLNSNWRDLNEKDGNEIILDLRSIENSIFEEETNYIQIFELYFNYLTRNELPITDCELKLKLIELSRYLGDDECILKIMRESSLLLRFYILFKFELIEPIHIAIASCYSTESSELSPLNIDDLSENILQVLLTQTELSELSKKEIFDAFEKKFKKIPSSTIISTNNKKVIHLKFTPDCPQNEINFNNTDIIFTLKEDQDSIIEHCDIKAGTLKIDSSHNFQIFGERAKFYIQLHHNDDTTVVGFWLDSNLDGTIIFNLSDCEYNFIHLIIFNQS